MAAWAGFLCREAATCLPGGSGQRCSPRHGWVRVAAPSFCVGAPCSSHRPLTELRPVCPAPAQLLCPLHQRVQTDTLHSQVLESPGCCPSLSVLLLAPAFFPPCPQTSFCCGRPNSLDLLSLGQEKGQSAGEGLPRRPGKLLAMAQGTTPPPRPPPRPYHRRPQNLPNLGCSAFSPMGQPRSEQEAGGHLYLFEAPQQQEGSNVGVGCGRTGWNWGGA